MATDETDSPYGLCKKDADFLKTFHVTLKELRGLVISNVEFYQRGNSSIHARYYAASCILFERLHSLEPCVIDIVPKLQGFDFSPQVPGNGYRSFVVIVNRCILHLLQLCRHINVNKNNLLFRSTHYLKELEAYVETLGQLIACLGYLKQLIALTRDGELFYEEENPEGDEILLEVEMLNTDCFYGRCLGFQFSDSIQKLLHVVMVAMATFSECYEESSQVILLASSLLNSSKYIVDQDMRAKQVVNVTRTADIKFCKAFWSIPDSTLLQHLRSLSYPNVEVSELMKLAPENFELPLKGSADETVTITPPCAHTGPAPVSVRLISHVFREGMQVNKKKVNKSKKGTLTAIADPKSKGLLFHCHGGGFVAQSSQSHENYLRVWARQLKMPILSVDYSLAPELPFPRALEECFYAYAWALKNPELLGWTGELVCFAGDSAGGNLVISTALRAISYQIRVPDGIMAAYTPMLVQYTPSPARLMSMIDPLLPVGILTRCLAAYSGIADKFSSALAEPIFCNAGKYESWEVVEPCDVTADSLGAKISKEFQAKSEVEPAESSTVNGHQGDYNPITNENSSRCHSIEDLEESDDGFVVCESEDLNQDSQHYKGKYTVIDKGFDCDKHVSSFNADAVDLSICDGDNCDSSDKKTKEFESPDEVKLTVDSHDDVDLTDDSNKLACTPKDGHELEVASGMMIEVNNYSKESQVENLTLGMRNDGDNLEQGYPHSQSITDALHQLDSVVMITVDEVLSGERRSSDTEADMIDVDTGAIDCHAASQDFAANKQDDMYMIVDTLSDMDRRSCHSIEDLSEKVVNQDSSCYGDITDSADSYDMVCGRDYGKCCSEKSHLGVGKGQKKSNGTLPKRAVSNPNFDQQLNEFTNFNIHQEPFNDQELVNSRQTGGLGDNTSSMNEKLHRRSMSLDFKSFYQENSSSSNSPSPVSRSPLSPKLPPGSRSFVPKRYSVQRKIKQSPIQLFRQLPIVKNFYMSPLLAPDEVLQGLPDIYLIACHFDPLLDDSVMFAKKLSKVGKMVDLQVMDHLPHGFLSFSDTSVEAKKASNVCLEKIMKVLQFEELK